MRTIFLLASLVVFLLAGCATGPTSPAGRAASDTAADMALECAVAVVFGGNCLR